MSTEQPGARLRAIEKVAGVENLYLRNDRGGTYYSRVVVNGTRSWKSLETTVRSIALVRHRKQQEATERARQAGVQPSTEFKQLGVCAAEYLRRLDQSELAVNSKKLYRDDLERLKKHWPRQNFEATPVHSISRDFLFDLRTILQRAKVAKGRKGCVREEFTYEGFSNVTINSTLNCLRRLLDIAVEKDAVMENPFNARHTLRGRITLKKDTRRPDVPSRETLQRVLEEIRRSPAAEVHEESGWVDMHRNWAAGAADFAEFLAYSGARWQEAAAVTVGDYTPAPEGETPTLHIPGFKTESSDRVIPVIPPLRRLLDRLTEGRNPGDSLLGRAGCLAPLKRACKRLGLPKLTQHDLRHYFATLCLEKTQDVKVVSEWLGHSDGGILVLKTYAHVLRGRSFALAAKVDWENGKPGAEAPGEVIQFNGSTPAAQVSGA